MSEPETSAKSVPAKPRVFISYSHDSPEHKRRVGALANQLCVDGINARIDQFVPDPDDGWIHWMRTQVKDSEKVLLVFTQTYQRRFEGDEEEARGLGVTFEGVIVTQMLYKSGGHNAKFRPVVFSEEDERFVPLELQCFNCYRVDTQENYETLLRWLYNAPLNIPPRGERPDLPPEPVYYLFPPEQEKTPGPVEGGTPSWYAALQSQPFHTVLQYDRISENAAVLIEFKRHLHGQWTNPQPNSCYVALEFFAYGRNQRAFAKLLQGQTGNLAAQDVYKKTKKIFTSETDFWMRVATDNESYGVNWDDVKLNIQWQYLNDLGSLFRTWQSWQKSASSGKNEDQVRTILEILSGQKHNPSVMHLYRAAFSADPDKLLVMVHDAIETNDGK